MNVFIVAVCMATKHSKTPTCQSLFNNIYVPILSKDMFLNTAE